MGIIAILRESTAAAPQAVTASVTDYLPVNFEDPLTVTEAPPLFYLDSSHLKELAWIIPLVLGTILLFVVIAAACYYGVRIFEVKVTKCCFRTFGCCDPGNSQSDETAYLGTSMKDVKGYTAYQLN